MKKLCILILLLTIFSSCKNDDDNLTPLEQLPMATQTGQGTFSCLVNGTPFIEIGTFFNCFYQFVNGEYFIGLAAENDKHQILDQIGLASNASEIEENMTYNLACNEPNSHHAEVVLTGLLLGEDTCTSNFGSLTITKLDFANNIVSGTFEFDIIHPNDNSVIQIREGRFYTLFTQ